MADRVADVGCLPKSRQVFEKEHLLEPLRRERHDDDRFATHRLRPGIVSRERAPACAAGLSER
jgi:hypothetical protein